MHTLNTIYDYYRLNNWWEWISKALWLGASYSILNCLRNTLNTTRKICCIFLSDIFYFLNIIMFQHCIDIISCYSISYKTTLFLQWLELHGDRAGYDDPALITGIGKIDDMTFMIVGHQKGRNTKENIHRNFAMPTPNGYLLFINDLLMHLKLESTQIIF